MAASHGTESTEPSSAPEPSSVAALRVLDRGLARVEEALLTAGLAALILLGAYQAIRRNFIPPAPFWADELLRYSVFFIGLVGGALAAQSDRLINIDMLTRLFSVRGKLVLRLLTAAFTIYVCWLFYAGGMKLRAVVADEEGELVRTATVVLALPVAAGLIATHLFLHSLIDVYYLSTGKTPPELLDQAPKA
jgi:TRAP-type C4-dicarboxylate transport system permease small subunit